MPLTYTQTHNPDQNPPKSYIAGPRQGHASRHCSNVPNTGSNSGGGQITIKNMPLTLTRMKNEDTQSDELLSIQKIQNKLARFLNNVNKMDHQSTESLLEKSKMLSVNRLNAQIKITEVWKALHCDPKQNAYKNSIPKINPEERALRSHSKGILQIKGHSNEARNSFLNDSKYVWNELPEAITSHQALNPPKLKIKTFVKSLPL